MKRKNQAYDFLLESILSNTLPPGAPIIETQIAETLNTSRTPVREALKELEKDGLVSHYALKGTIVNEITPYDVEEIFSLRIMLEVAALELAYTKVTEEELNHVENMFLTMDKTSTSRDYALADKALHALIIDQAGNYRLKQFINILNVQIERYRRIAAMEPTRLINSQKEHLAIISALRQRDLQACKQSLRNHLNSVKASTLDAAKLLFMARKDKS